MENDRVISIRISLELYRKLKMHLIEATNLTQRNRD